MLHALTGHKNLVQFYEAEAYEDEDNVYVVMELCKGRVLLDRILSRGGKYPEEDAKIIMVQILNVVAYCHLQSVVHRDLKPENFLFTSKDENSCLKAIDFGLSDYVKPGHPWVASIQDVKIPLDMIAFKLVKAYVCSSSEEGCLRGHIIRAKQKWINLPSELQINHCKEFD